MRAKGDLPRETDFPQDDSERVRYSINIIHKVLVLRQGIIPNYVSLNLKKYLANPKSCNPNEIPLLLDTFSIDPIEIHYLWTAAVLFGFNPQVIYCSSQERSTSSHDYKSDVVDGFDIFFGGGFGEKLEDLTKMVNVEGLKGSAFSKKSLYETMFKQHLPQNNFQWLRDEKTKIQEELDLLEKNIQFEKEKHEKIKAADDQKKYASQRLVETTRDDFPKPNAVLRELEKGADINYQDENRYTPLIESIMHGHDGIAELLLQQGADPLIRIPQGKLASDFAIQSSPLYQVLKQKERAAILEKLPQRERFSELLHDAMGAFDITGRKIDTFLERGADVNYQDSEEFTVLMLAVDKDNERIAEYLLRCGANPLLKNKKGKTARDYASRNSGIYTVLMGYELIFLTQAGHLAGLHTLLNYDDTVVNFRCHRGFTALLIAVEKGLFEVAKLLLSRGADISLIRMDGVSVFDLTQNKEMLELLKIAAGANEDELDDQESAADASNNLITEPNRFFSGKRTSDSESRTLGLELHQSADQPSAEKDSSKTAEVEKLNL